MAEVKFSETDTRIKRGVKLAEDRGHEITRDGDTFRVPGSNGERYTVRLEDGYCSCPDHRHRGGTCKHLYAAEIAAAHEACRRRRTAKPKRVRHDDNSLRGVVADPNALEAVAERLGV